MKIIVYLGYKVIPLKAIGHSIGAAFILEIKSGEFCAAAYVYTVLITVGYFCVTATYFF